MPSGSGAMPRVAKFLVMSFRSHAMPGLRDERKIFSCLKKAGIVTSSEDIRGGYRLSRSPEKISVLEVTDAVEGNNPLFDCKEIRGDCALFEDGQPEWACSGVCGIHAVMLRAERAMRAELVRTSLATLVTGMARKGMPDTFRSVAGWLADR